METQNKERLHFLINESNKVLFQNISGSNYTLGTSVICKGDIEACLLALSGDHCNSDPFEAYFIEILMQIRDFSKVIYSILGQIRDFVPYFRVHYLEFPQYWIPNGFCGLTFKANQNRNLVARFNLTNTKINKLIKN